VVDFGADAMIYNASTIDEIQVVGKTRTYGGLGKYSNAPVRAGTDYEYGCRSIDFVDTTSDCYLQYKNDEPNGLRQYYIADYQLGKAGTAVDSETNAGSGSDSYTTLSSGPEDTLVFEIEMQESQVQLESSIEKIQTWQDVAGAVGGLMGIAGATVIALMNQIETSLDPKGPVAEKLSKLGEVAKNTGERAAKAGGVNMVAETPDIIFAHDDHQADVESPLEIGPDGEADLEVSMGNQPDFDSLVLMSQVPSSRSGRSTGASSVEIFSGSSKSVSVPATSVTQI
jgi:hypothetical protein